MWVFRKEEGKMEENFEKLVKEMRKQVIATRIVMACNIVLLLCVFILTLAVVNFAPKLTEVVEKTNVLMTQVSGVVEDAKIIAKDVEDLAEDTQTLIADTETLAKGATEAIGKIDEVIDDVSAAIDQIGEVIPTLDSATKDISDIAASLNDEGLPKLYENLDALNKVDIETLNNSIKSLHNVVEPLAKLFGK